MKFKKQIKTVLSFRFEDGLLSAFHLKLETPNFWEGKLMAMRSPKEMKLHETIIRSVAGIYDSQKNAQQVLTNLDKPLAVLKGITVDIIVKNPITLIFKVETETSVTEGEGIAWKAISEQLGTFFLLVPHPLKADAMRIIAKLGVKNIRLCFYMINENKLKFTGLP